MSAEEKKKTVEKPVIDYSKKNFYELLNLKNDASEETLKSTYAELSKKYNPITNPDEISKYQDIYKAGEVLTDPVNKRFYDEYGDMSYLIYDVLRVYFPMKEVERPSNYIYGGLFGVSGISIALIVSIMAILARIDETYVYNWYYAFIPTLLISCGYLIYIIFKTKNDLSDAKSKKDEKEKEQYKTAAIRSNCMCAVRAILITLFQFALGYHFKNESKCGFIVAAILYLAFECVALLRDTIQFKKVSDAMKSGKEVDCPNLKNDIFIKFLIGKANAKDKDGKKASASSYYGHLCLYLYKDDLIRLVQVILIGLAYLIKPSNYTVFFLPTFIQAILNLAQGTIQSRIGYVRGTTELTSEVFKSVVYCLISFDTVMLLLSLNYNIINFTSHSFPAIVQLALLVGFLLGVLPFVLIMEFKIKHDETDVPY